MKNKFCNQSTVFICSFEFIIKISRQKCCLLKFLKSASPCPILFSVSTWFIYNIVRFVSHILRSIFASYPGWPLKIYVLLNFTFCALHSIHCYSFIWAVPSIPKLLHAVPLETVFPLTPHSPPAVPGLFSSLEFCLCRLSHKWNHKICNRLLGLIFFTLQNAFDSSCVDQ